MLVKRSLSLLVGCVAVWGGYYLGPFGLAWVTLSLAFQSFWQSVGCGCFGIRFRPFTNVDEIFGLTPRYNIAPTQQAPVIVQADGKRTLELFRWGLIPWWAKDPAIGNRMINARAETLAEKPANNKAARSARQPLPDSEQSG